MLPITTLIHLVVDPSRDPSTLPTVDYLRKYFFDVQTGICGFWLAQTNYKLALVGDVLPWAPLPYSSTAHSRAQIIDNYINTFTSVWGGGASIFAQLNIIVDATPLVQANPPTPMPIDGGRHGSFVVMSLGDTFSFADHEVGHAAFKLAHSFDRSLLKYDQDANPGEYGSPYCIMSSAAFGNRNVIDDEPAGFEGMTGYKSYGIGLSVATRVRRGWANSTVVVPTTSAQRLDLSSAGNLRPGPPQALEILGTDGGHYIVSYRTPVDRFDHMLKGAAVVLEQVDGGAAELHPGVHAATYIGEIPLPVDLGSNASCLVGPGFTLQVVNWDPATQQYVTLSVSEAPQQQLSFGTEPTTTLTEAIANKGHSSFAAGEVTCVAGEYDWTVIAAQQEVVVYAEFNGMFPTYQWKINGEALPADKGFLKLKGVACRTYPPIPTGGVRHTPVDLTYELLAPGRLALRNVNPAQGAFQVSVSVEIGAAWVAKAFEAVIPASLAGSTLVMDPQLEIDRIACEIKKSDLMKHTQQRVLLLPGDIWQRLSGENARRGLALIDTMTHSESKSVARFVEASKAFSKLVGQPDAPLEFREIDF